MLRKLTVLMLFLTLVGCAPAPDSNPTTVPTPSPLAATKPSSPVPAPTLSSQQLPSSAPSATAASAQAAVSAATATRSATAAPTLGWRSASVDGDVYASPVVANGRVYVATQANSVYALDEASGKTVWQTTIGTPVPRSSLPCGNIATTGILGRPVLSPDGSKLYAVAFVAPGTHSFVVLDTATGKVLSRQVADPAGANPLVEQQRSALVVANNRVYVAYGGLWGDCGPYHGWMVAMDPVSGQMVASYQVPTNREGGIWAPGGPLIGANGDLYVATGNGDATKEFDYGDAVLRLTPALTLASYFAPTDWAKLNADDTDIGSTAPTAVGSALIFQIGKSGQGYLVHSEQLGGIGGEAFSGRVCGASFGGTTYVAPYLYVPCVDGMNALRVDPNAPSFTAAWTTKMEYPGQSALAAGTLWMVSRDGYLVGLAPDTGKQISRTAVGSVTHFAAPTVADGKLFVPGARQVLEFNLGGG